METCVLSSFFPKIMGERDSTERGQREKNKAFRVYVVVESLSHVRLCDIMDCSPPGFSVHGISQARILEWAVLPFSRGSSQLREGFPSGSDGKESGCNAGDPDSIPGLGRSSGEENGYPLQYSCLENPMDRGAWWASVDGVANGWPQLTT